MWDDLLRSVKKHGWYFVHTLTGIHLSTPTHYLDWSMMSSSFPAPVERLQEKLPSKKLTPIQSASGSAIVVFRAMEIRQARELPPYNEFAVEIPVSYTMGEETRALTGAYILYMPVTTEDARWGGVDIYGLPKFIAEIHFEEKDEVRQCQVRVDGKEIITLEVKKIAVKPESWNFYFYGVRDGRLLRTLIEIQGEKGTAGIKGYASYVLGNHPIAEELKSMEIDEVSIAHEYAPKLQSIDNNPSKPLPL